MISAPLVSILIPAYNVRFFEHALRSAVEQDFSDREIIVCDDSAREDIARICERLSDHTVSYSKNAANLGFSANFTQCFTRARGKYLKFLNDDDVLHPTCVSRMVNAFETHGDKLVLVSSRRLILNERGERCQDSDATRPLAYVTSYMDGRALGDFVLMHSVNFIGEPTTVMFRKRDIEIVDGGLFMLDGIDYVCLAESKSRRGSTKAVAGRMVPNSCGIPSTRGAVT